MGYIAPVFHFHYLHYHERSQRPVSEPLRVHPVEKKQKIIHQSKSLAYERQYPRSNVDTASLGQVIDERV